MFFGNGRKLQSQTDQKGKKDEVPILSIFSFLASILTNQPSWTQKRLFAIKQQKKRKVKENVLILFVVRYTEETELKKLFFGLSKVFKLSKHGMLVNVGIYKNSIT